MQPGVATQPGLAALGGLAVLLHSRVGPALPQLAVLATAGAVVAVGRAGPVGDVLRGGWGEPSRHVGSGARRSIVSMPGVVSR
jgi:hypothetical protein